MNKSKIILTAMALGGTVALATPTWSQDRPAKTKPGEENPVPGSEQKGNTGTPLSTQSTPKTASDRQDKIPTKVGSEQNLPPTADQKGVSGLSKDEIMQVERALQTKGYKPGTVDGVMDDSTREAVRAFQKDNSLPITGSIDDKTAAKLGVTLKTKTQPASK
jgi:peptidoglycan hydrolase-like protein with peptidoglycan-binding domain